ncbi:MAG: hypothetical protein CMD57_04790 [Gammaproteobacteria bacterium]|nr:hypothetical protein [Gammaproteobacteria bacterium]
MSFTYAQLKQAVQDFSENTETSFVTNLPVFIRGAEDRIFSVVDLELFRKNATSALTNNDPFLSCPTDFLAPFSFRITTANNERFLLIKDVNYIQEYNKSISNTLPKYYGIYDVDNFIVGPTPDSNYTVELHYYYRPASITAGADSAKSWLSENAPNALLYGSLVEAYTYMKGEPDMMQLYEQRFAQEVQRLKDLAEARENSDAYRRGLPDRPRT